MNMKKDQATHLTDVHKYVIRTVFLRKSGQGVLGIQKENWG